MFQMRKTRIAFTTTSPVSRGETSKALIDRLTRHAGIFERIASVRSGFEASQLQPKGQEARMLANDIRQAMALVAELKELRDLAGDFSVSNDRIGMRIRAAITIGTRDDGQRRGVAGVR